MDEGKKLVKAQNTPVSQNLDGKEAKRLAQFQKATEEDPMAKVLFFRDKIRNLSLDPKNHHLKDIDVEELGEEDMGFFERFEQGKFGIEDIEKQERVLAFLDEAKTYKKLLAHMRSQILKEKGF